MPRNRANFYCTSQGSVGVISEGSKEETMHAAVLMRRWSGVAAAAVMFAQLAPTTVAAAAGPFDGLEGVWTGDGMLTYSNGTQERLACRVQYLSPTPTN